MSGRATLTIVASIDTTSRLRQQIASTRLGRAGEPGPPAAGEIVVFMQLLYKHNCEIASTGTGSPSRAGGHVASEHCGELAPSLGRHAQRARVANAHEPAPGGEMVEERGGEPPGHMIAPLRPVEAGIGVALSAQGRCRIDADRLQPRAARTRHLVTVLRCDQPAAL